MRKGKKTPLVGTIPAMTQKGESEEGTYAVWEISRQQRKRYVTQKRRPDRSLFGGYREGEKARA